MIRAALTDLGWFDTGRAHLPVLFVAETVDPMTEVTLNTLALADEDISDFELEMGSLLSEHRWTFWVDFYAENKSIGIELIGDVRAILEGRLSSIDRGRPIFQVYDYDQATPTVIFTCEIEDVSVDRARDFPNPWQKNWYSCVFEIVDSYGRSDDE